MTYYSSSFAPAATVRDRSAVNAEQPCNIGRPSLPFGLISSALSDIV